MLSAADVPQIISQHGTEIRLLRHWTGKHRGTEKREEKNPPPGFLTCGCVLLVRCSLGV